MKKITKIFLFAVAAAVVFSCAKENQTSDIFPEGNNPGRAIVPAVDGGTLTSFRYTLEGASTKVTVNLGDGVTAIENGDEVLVYVGEDNKAIYVYDGANTQFNLKSDETAVVLSGEAGVFYPADEFEAGTSVKFVMPSAIEATGDFGAINPMAGMIEGEAGSYKVSC